MWYNNILKICCFVVLLSNLFINKGAGQEDIKNSGMFVQFSGIVLTADSNYPIPYATVKIENTFRGTIANLDGFFSLVTKENDIVEFSAMGFKKVQFRIPENSEDQKYSVLVALKADTITFDEALIYPWPPKDKFEEAFVNLQLEDDYLTLAKRNLSKHEMARIFNSMGMDGRENQKYALNQIAMQANYLGGLTNYAQFPGLNTPIPLSLLDPFAWARFIKDLKEGKFKKKKENY